MNLERPFRHECFDIETARDAAVGRAALSPEEARILAALAAPKRRRDWLLGRLAAKRALRRILREERGLDLPLDRIEILNEPSGRPFCRLPGGAAAPAFSISHTDEGGLCAVSRSGGPIGADWEAIRPRDPAVLRLFADPSERGPDLESSPAALTALWSLKEAVLKLLGVGLGADPRDIRRVPGSGWAESIGLYGEVRRKWVELGSPLILHHQRLSPGSVVTVAYAS